MQYSGSDSNNVSAPLPQWSITFPPPECSITPPDGTEDKRRPESLSERFQQHVLTPNASSAWRMFTVPHRQKMTKKVPIFRTFSGDSGNSIDLHRNLHPQKTQQDAYKASTSSMLSWQRDPGTLFILITLLPRRLINRLIKTINLVRILWRVIGSPFQTRRIILYCWVSWFEVQMRKSPEVKWAFSNWLR